jgi:peptidoglycan/xylan/chitin deacetylase (PgdA/CDA1 family)
VRAQALRVALTSATGFELCRTAVREGLLGQPLDDVPSLYAQLWAARLRAEKRNDQVASNGRMEKPSIGLAPGAARALARALPAGIGGIVLGQHSGGIGSSASRRAVLPVAATQALVETAAILGQPIIQVGEPDQPVARVIYAPDVLARATPAARSAVPGTAVTDIAPKANVRFYDRTYFEALFACQADPWQYSNSQYEQVKYAQTLELLPDEPFAQGLELACAEGHFTVHLAPRVGHLLAADISQVALERNAQRCAHLLGNIAYARLDLARDPIPGHFDLIVCSEVLYFVGGRKELEAVGRKITDALNPGGYLVMAHANLIVDDPDQTGYDWELPFGARVIGETFAATQPLQLVRELRTPLYRIQLFQYPKWTWSLHPGPETRVTEIPQPTPAPPRAAATVRWQGGTARRMVAPTVQTNRLPILMYHRIAPEGAAALARYRLTPDTFEAQLRYLHDAGYYSIGLPEWRAAMELKRPLPGRAILLTFDDGYQDFVTYAWPLLKQYGFTATVFLVAEAIGGVNQWDAAYGETAPLMDWPDICRLRDEGVTFGAHSATHQPLVGLTPAEIVLEYTRSRLTLEQALATPVESLAYPYGATNALVAHLAGACGYVYGLTCTSASASLHDSLLALPRLEIASDDGLTTFIAKLNM